MTDGAAEIVLGETVGVSDGLGGVGSCEGGCVTTTGNSLGRKEGGDDGGCVTATVGQVVAAGTPFEGVLALNGCDCSTTQPGVEPAVTTATFCRTKWQWLWCESTVHEWAAGAHGN
jgi:hypothetical protein